jgi:hypothetical protein
MRLAKIGRACRDTLSMKRQVQHNRNFPVGTHPTPASWTLPFISTFTSTSPSPTSTLLHYMINIPQAYIHRYKPLPPLLTKSSVLPQCLAIPTLQSPWARLALEHLAQAHPKACSALLNASMIARTSVLSSNVESAQVQTVQSRWVQAVRQTNVPRPSPFQLPSLRAPETSDLVWPVQ